jgi:hypothetical protein
MASDGVTPGRTISVAGEAILDAVDPNWQTGTQASTIVHYIYDPATRFLFEVYPPAVAGTKIELTYSAVPPVISSAGTTITLPDMVATALVDYLCYRCLTKDAEFGDISEKAAAHYKLFTDAIGKYM